jgi:hypothetical protein
MPIQDSGRAQGAFNVLLRSHKLLSVDRRWVEQGASSFGRLCVDYLEGAPAEGGGYRGGRGPGGTGKIDDRDTLRPADFAAFARLRDVRKESARAEGVPVSTIVTDEQLAPLVRSRATAKAALEKIAASATPASKTDAFRRRRQARGKAGGGAGADRPAPARWRQARLPARTALAHCRFAQRPHGTSPVAPGQSGAHPTSPVKRRQSSKKSRRSWLTRPGLRPNL